MSTTQRIPWGSMKQLVDAKKLKLQYFNLNNAYFIQIADGALIYETVINKADADSSEIVDDFETNYMPKGNRPIDETTLEIGAKKVALYKPEDSSTSKVSHDWTDKCTWYTDSVEVLGESLVNEGNGVWVSENSFWIDVTHARLYMEDNLQKYKNKIYDNGTLLIEDVQYQINYETGKVSFIDYTPTTPITADYYYATSSVWKLIPDQGKALVIEHSELQVSEDVMMNKPISFVIWTGNPYFDPTQPEVEWFEGAQFGVDNFKQFPFKTVRYKTIRDIINGSNLGQGYIPKVSGLLNNVLVFPFNYVSLQSIKSSNLTELRISIDGDEPMGGEWGTVTFYVISKPE